MNKDIWYTVYGAFAPEPRTFREEPEAHEYAKGAVNDWAPKVTVVKSEVIAEYTR